MRLLTFEHQGIRQAGVLEGDSVRPIVGVSELGSATLEHCLTPAQLDYDDEIPVAAVHLLPPVPSPGKIICVGLNYKTHVAETGRALPEYPVLFTKFASALVGPTDPIRIPTESEEIDYEAELAVVIGRRVRRVSVDEALSAVAGFAVANDVTVRDYQYKTHQWLQGKAWDQLTPIGPALVTCEEVQDPAKLHIELRLNGEVMQSAELSTMIFDVPRLVSFISVFTTLEPGDVLLTGTPGGVGYRRDPKVFLSQGDTVEVEIPGVGRIHNAVIDEQPAGLGVARSLVEK